MKVVGVNWYTRRYENLLTGKVSSNVGDANCSPLQYFDFPNARMRSIEKKKPARKATVVIFGGGSFPSRVQRRLKYLKRATRIAWGVGWTERGKLRPMRSDVHKKLASRFHIYGHRDWGCEGEYVPCVSTMSEHFDREYKTYHEIAFFGHPHDCPEPRPVPIEGAPVMYNDEMDMSKVIAFLASADTIVTGSYHGVYWATLLGRKVVAHPYSAKFWHFKYPPVLTDDWRLGVQKARRYSGVLEECRELNRRFYVKVMDLIHSAHPVPA